MSEAVQPLPPGRSVPAISALLDLSPPELPPGWLQRRDLSAPLVVPGPSELTEHVPETPDPSELLLRRTHSLGPSIPVESDPKVGDDASLDPSASAPNSAGTSPSNGSSLPEQPVVRSPAPVCAEPLSLSAAAPAVATTPASPPAAVETALCEELRHCIGAFGRALEANDQRRTRDALHTLLTAQQENQAMFMQALADLRLEYTDNLGRAVDQLVERMAEELTPTSIMGLGNLFRDSANEITASIRRSERLQSRMLEVLGGLGEGLERLAEQVTTLSAHLAQSEAWADAEPPRRVLASKSSIRPVRAVPAGSPLERLEDDDD